MPNQKNYPEEIERFYDYRPDRIAKPDLALIAEGQKNALFGSDPRDIMEVWIYYPDGSYAAHKYVNPSDDILRLATVVDNTGAYEYLAINMEELAQQIYLAAGRYTMTVNFFRDEVGSNNSYKLFISDISDDRTELILSSIEPTEQIKRDIYEFATPSVPRQDAQALIEQTFDRALENTGTPAEILDITDVRVLLEKIQSTILEKINYARADAALQDLFTKTLQTVYSKTITKLINDKTNKYIQEAELVAYVYASIKETIYQLKQQSLIDNRFELI